MPKASKVGKARAAAKASSRNVKEAPLTSQFLAGKKASDAVDDDLSKLAEKEKESLSRGQRKRLAKREQYLKREKMVMSSLRLQKLEEQKGKLDGLDAIREALGEAAAPSSKSLMDAAKEIAAKSKANAVSNKLTGKSNKSKKTIATTEISHMGLVLQHPSFQENPFAAIQIHLKNSLATDAEKLTEESEKRTQEDKEIEAKKKEERKERIRDAKFAKTQRKGRSGFKSNRAGRI
jgi:hypothetical protein